jgi:hypothetical protein
LNSNDCSPVSSESSVYSPRSSVTALLLIPETIIPPGPNGASRTVTPLSAVPSGPVTLPVSFTPVSSSISTSVIGFPSSRCRFMRAAE